MTIVASDPNRRILVVDDTQEVHEDFRKILLPRVESGERKNLRAALIGGGKTAVASAPKLAFEVEFAMQGAEGAEKVRIALEQCSPYAMAFVDMRMPPGADGLETIKQMWRIDNEIQAVICTAYSDYTWDQIIAELGHSDRLLLLKKPFDPAEVWQLACALTSKWQMTRAANIRQKELESKIALRTEDLVAALRKADAANQAKTNFLANMSHEIRTPMTAILGFAQNLTDPMQSDIEKLDCVHTILRNGDYLLNIINDILDLSKIEADMMTIDRTDCRPCMIIAEVFLLMSMRANAKDLPLSVEYIGAIPETIQSDPVRIRQILLNMIGNAIKFTERGAIRLVARRIEGDGEGSLLQFDVIDTGPGISEHQIASLFRPFTQADNSTTREFGGTGLGLCISKRFAELLGGDLCVAETDCNRGTTFRATVSTGLLEGVRMEKDPVSVSVVPNPDATAVQSTSSILERTKILLAEDNPTNQTLVMGILKKAGAEIAVVADGKLAVDAAMSALDSGAPYDVILMDMQMPVMDGYEATDRLRRNGYTLPIIALTAHAMESDREKCIRSGCDDYTTKPINREKLVKAIRDQVKATYAAAGSQGKPVLH